jgi:hypothetical protein
MINATTDTVITSHTRSRARAHPHPLSVYDGTTLVGHLIRHGDNFEAIGADGVGYGTFTDMKSAAFALPKRSAS